jgi:hypothetical protein
MLFGELRVSQLLALKPFRLAKVASAARIQPIYETYFTVPSELRQH